MQPLIVGSRDDLHVRAVADLLREPSVVLDARSLTEASFEFNPPHILIRDQIRTFDSRYASRGWLRRLSPMSWEAGTTIGSHDAAAKASWLALLAALLRHPDIPWLSDVDAITAAENKLTQYTAASRLGITAPRTLVSNSPGAITTVGQDMVAKPLGPGHFQDQDGYWRSVFTDTFDPTDPEDVELLAGPPFILQERLRATAHLRIATVEDRAWVFHLSAEGLPIDWREVDRGHRDWEQIQDDGIGRLAVITARAHNLGYSSQDWIESGDKRVFLELNPNGQWLFLPSPGADEVTASIAAWLERPCD